MEKLLNLLKQYWKRTFNDETLLRISYEEKTDCFYWQYQPKPGMKLEQGQMLETPVVFSKHFGFIKRLVDNDKIKMGTYEYDGYHMNVFEYQALLMLLSIQDSPLEFLISILK